MIQEGKLKHWEWRKTKHVWVNVISVVFPHKLFKIYMTIDSKNIRLVEVSMCVDIINGDYNTKRGKAKET